MSHPDLVHTGGESRAARRRAARAEQAGGKVSPSLLLVEAVEAGFDLFHDRRGRGYAMRDASTWQVPSEELFLDALVPLFRELAPGGLLSREAASTVGANLLSVARAGPERQVFTRLGWDEGGAVLYLDLGDATRRSIALTATGWHLLERAPVPFLRHDGMGSLPEPSLEGGDVDLLRRVVHVEDDRQLLLLNGWLLGVMSPAGPYPILNLVGEAGSGKSLAARMLRDLVDPTDAALLRQPESARSLAVAIDPLRVAAFDNLTHLDQWLSDLFCLMPQGGTIVERRLYSDRGRETFDLLHPAIVTSLVPIATQPDLSDRTVVIELPPLDDERRRDERELWAEFERVRPAILAGLLDGVAAALANRDAVELDHPSRMADHVRWVEAGGAAFGWAPGLYASTFNEARAEAAADAGDASPLWVLLRPLADAPGGFEGSAAMLLDRIRIDSAGALTRERWWPRTPDALGRALVRLGPNLRKLGYVLERERAGHDRGRIIRLRRAGDERAPAPVLPLRASSPAGAPTVEEVVAALRAAGLDEAIPAPQAAALALKKSGGNAFLASRALEALGVPAPGGTRWTAERLRGVL